MNNLQEVINKVKTTAKGIDFAADKFSTEHVMTEYIEQNRERLMDIFEAEWGVKPDNIWYDETANAIAIQVSFVPDHVVEMLGVAITINPKGQTDI